MSILSPPIYTGGYGTPQTPPLQICNCNGIPHPSPPPVPCPCGPPSETTKRAPPRGDATTLREKRIQTSFSLLPKPRAGPPRFSLPLSKYSGGVARPSPPNPPPPRALFPAPHYSRDSPPSQLPTGSRGSRGEAGAGAMGKYMRKSKASGEVAVMEVAGALLGVRTRSRTLAAQQQRAPSPSPSPQRKGQEDGDPGAGDYLELRSRRLEKQPPPGAREKEDAPQRPRGGPPPLAGGGWSRRRRSPPRGSRPTSRSPSATTCWTGTPPTGAPGRRRRAA
ncbi:hypothetical protein CFC21_059316 [Triticum aestivum]|uniref:Uncharacterized protein n=2 Tax=Triticum aestivum TaxID=4565 RepID=A0A9R1GQK8_WHEAT|nr:hypothetical protein CFC21_059315 [Triticum aestivum]KAF7051030.1 hypothetical protein CFC21_059316 [Triticum aestivum]